MDAYPTLLSDNENTSFDPDLAIELLTIPEAARLLKISISTVRRLQQGRVIPFLKIGGSVRFAKQDLVSFLQKTRVESIGT